MRHAFTTLAVISACAFTPGCDDDDEDRDAGGRDAGAPVGESVAEVLQDDDRFETFAFALEQAGLLDELETTGAVTVFAPTDAAFDAAGITGDDIEALPIDQLRQLLLYHWIPGRTLPSADLTSGPLLTSADLTLFVGADGAVVINRGSSVEGGADVVVADVAASNGVIHGIGGILSPPDVTDLAVYGGLTSLVDALVATDLLDTLSAADTVTVFAPTNEAFAALGAPPDTATLRNVLLYHVVDETLTAEELAALTPPVANSLATNAFGNPLVLVFGATAEGGVEVNDTAVVIADLRATNGVVHVIGSVLIPPNIVEMIELADLTGLQAALAAAARVDGTPLTDLLAGPGPLTLFAPSNAAFADASDTLATLTPEQVRDVLLFHVLDPAAFPAPVLMPALPASPAQLPTLWVDDAVLESTAPPIIEGANVIVPDINVTNGVIHVIDAVLIPETL